MSFISKLKNKMSNSMPLSVISFCMLPVFVFLCLACIEYANYGSYALAVKLWSDNFGKFIFAYSVLLIISIALVFVCYRLWIYTVAFGSLTVIISIINCVKHAINGDYFFPWDISMAGNMGQLVGFAKFDLPPMFWLFPAVFALFTVFYAFTDAKIKLKWYYRIIPLCAGTVAFIVMFNSTKSFEKLINSAGMSLNDSILQSSNYSANGFVNAFTINCFALKLQEPDGYSKDKIDEYLSKYETDGAENKSENDSENKPDVIVILSEAFFDVRTLKGTEFSQNPYSNFDEIIKRPNAYSGKMYTTAYGGGTVRSEFEVLTGLTVDYLTNGTSPYLYVSDELESYVSNYSRQGYSTTGIHTYDGKFYMRETAYPLLGFDEFIAKDVISKREDVAYRRGYITDDVFMNVLIEKLEQNKDKPNFIFGITMENHGGYDKANENDIVIQVKNDSLSTEMLDAVTCYTQGAYYADKSLGKLIDYVDNCEKDTLVLFFGDHLPTLGPNQLAYREAGSISNTDMYSTEDWGYIFSTPFLFYSNFDVDYDSVMKDQHEISTYYLLTKAAQLCNTEMTPYMKYLSDCCDKVPYYNVRLKLDLTDDRKKLTESMKYITYDRIRGKKYSVN